MLTHGLWFSICLWAWRIWCFIKMYYIGFWSLGKQLWETHKDPTNDLPENLSGHVIIITGGGTGIGLEVTRELIQREATLIMASHDMELMENSVKMLRAEYPTGKVDCMLLDLRSFRSVQNFVEEFNKKYRDLHILINNAGVMFPSFTLTDNGFEEQFGINYLGHSLLSLLLLAKLRLTGSEFRCSRIVNVASSTHLVADNDIPRWFHSEPESFSPHSAYSNSKLAIILATYHLNRQLMGENSYVTVNCLHPGVVDTALYQNLHWTIGWFFRSLGKLIFLRPYEGAHTVLYTALSPDIEREGGMYIENSSPARSLDISYSTCLQQQLWEKTNNVLSPYLKES